MRRHVSPGRLAGAGLALLVLLGLVLWLTPSNDYIFLPDRAHPVAPLVKVASKPSPPGPGGIYFVDILVRKATLLERLFPHLHEGGELVPPQAVRAPGQSDTQRHEADLREMSTSQEIAAAVAERAAGYAVRTTYTGALVDGTFPGLPAAGKLLPTDVIVSVDGAPVRKIGDLRRLIVAHASAPLRLGFRRGSSLQQVILSAVRQAGRPVIGVQVEQAAHVKLPVPVTIDAGSVGGPSAGLAFALQVYATLGHNVTHGYKVAATGQIQFDGSVAPIGGAAQKAIGVRRAGVGVFLVPAGDNARDAKLHAGAVRVIPVQSFQQALRALATLPRKH
ncbi:MAG TPA: S16 family serine protease [Gaiellaceae bacterium]|nr:S16 family serine protease [Gaiellaceae bacterium]